MIAAWVAGTATAASIGIAWLVHVRLAGWLPEDVANARRKRHSHATPLAGSIPALASVVVCSLHDRPWLAAGCAVAAAVGFVDDRHKAQGDGIDWRAKAIGLAVATTLGWLQLDRSAADGWLACATFWIGVFVMSNAVNFLDNAHGVAASLGSLALCLAGGPASGALAACWLAFIPFNWPHGKLFLGDSGALALGVLVGVTTIDAGTSGASGSDWTAVVAPAAVFWADFVQVVCARLWLGYAPWVADRRHLTHIAGNLGVPPAARAPLLVTLAVAGYFGITRLA